MTYFLTNDRMLLRAACVLLLTVMSFSFEAKANSRPLTSAYGMAQDVPSVFSQRTEKMVRSLTSHAKDQVPLKPLSSGVSVEPESLNDAKNKALHEQAEDLEAVFLSVMIEPMIPEGQDAQLFGGGQANSIYRSLMIQEYGKVLSSGGGVGLAASIEKDMKRR